MNPAGNAATCGLNKVARRLLQLGGRPCVSQLAIRGQPTCVMASPDPSIRQRRVGALTEEMRARMNRPSPKIVRRRFLIALGHAVHVTWPVLSTILAIQVVYGVLLGFVEGWSVGDALYFTFVTGLTIGYGDIVPRQALGRALAIGVGISGLFLTGLIAEIAVLMPCAQRSPTAIPADANHARHPLRVRRRV